MSRVPMKMENAACNPVSLAGKTMLACENLLMSFRNEEQLLNVIFRIGETWSADNVTDELLTCYVPSTRARALPKKLQ